MRGQDLGKTSASIHYVSDGSFDFNSLSMGQSAAKHWAKRTSKVVFACVPWWIQQDRMVMVNVSTLFLIIFSLPWSAFPCLGFRPCLIKSSTFVAKCMLSKMAYHLFWLVWLMGSWTWTRKEVKAAFVSSLWICQRENKPLASFLYKMMRIISFRISWNWKKSVIWKNLPVSCH